MTSRTSGHGAGDLVRQWGSTHKLVTSAHWHKSVPDMTLDVAMLLKACLVALQEAVLALNTLQSNAAVLEKTKKERDRNRHLNGPATIGFAARTGLTVRRIVCLSVCLSVCLHPQNHNFICCVCVSVKHHKA